MKLNKYLWSSIFFTGGATFATVLIVTGNALIYSAIIFILAWLLVNVGVAK